MTTQHLLEVPIQQPDLRDTQNRAGIRRELLIECAVCRLLCHHSRRSSSTAFRVHNREARYALEVRTVQSGNRITKVQRRRAYQQVFERNLDALPLLLSFDASPSRAMSSDTECTGTSLVNRSMNSSRRSWRAVVLAR
jgi:hypothetical protein